MSRGLGRGMHDMEGRHAMAHLTQSMDPALLAQVERTIKTALTAAVAREPALAEIAQLEQSAWHAELLACQNHMRGLEGKASDLATRLGELDAVLTRGEEDAR